MKERIEEKVFEDQQDYVEDVKEQIRSGVKRYVLYMKMFGYPYQWKILKDELKRFINYEMESAFSKTVIRDTEEGTIIMRFDEKKE